MNEPLEDAHAYQSFFFKSEAGKKFMLAVQSLETGHIANAQKLSDINELNKSAGNKEVIDHINSVIAQVAG